MSFRKHVEILKMLNNPQPQVADPAYDQAELQQLIGLLESASASRQPELLQRTLAGLPVDTLQKLHSWMVSPFLSGMPGVLTMKHVDRW